MVASTISPQFYIIFSIFSKSSPSACSHLHCTFFHFCFCHRLLLDHPIYLVHQGTVYLRLDPLVYSPTLKGRRQSPGFSVDILSQSAWVYQLVSECWRSEYTHCFWDMQCLYSSRAKSAWILEYFRGALFPIRTIYLARLEPFGPGFGTCIII